MVSKLRIYTDAYSQGAQALRYLREHKAPDSVLKRYLWDLYYRGFSAVDIWRMYHSETSVLTPTYSTMRSWIRQGETCAPLNHRPMPAWFMPPDFRHPDNDGRFKTGRIYPQIPRNMISTFQQAAEETRQIRGATDQFSELWMSRKIFHDLISAYYRRGIRISDIARVAGVTHRAIALRLTEMGLK